jgi:hypothetical protein
MLIDDAKYGQLNLVTNDWGQCEERQKSRWPGYVCHNCKRVQEIVVATFFGRGARSMMAGMTTTIRV